MLIDDMERGLREARERRRSLEDALMEAARDLWFAAEVAAIGGGSSDALSLALQGKAWQAERVAIGHPDFMNWTHSDIRPAHASKLPPMDPPNA